MCIARAGDLKIHALGIVLRSVRRTGTVESNDLMAEDVVSCFKMSQCCLITGVHWSILSKAREVVPGAKEDGTLVVHLLPLSIKSWLAQTCVL